MSPDTESQPKEKTDNSTPQADEPGLFDYYGSFPVWLLRIIDTLTPDALIKKSPPKKKE